jgi:N-acetylglutamate synthase-like GNAT family acetyltransferase
MSQYQDLIISEDKQLLNIDKTHQLLLGTPWAQKRTRATVVKSITNSLCFGAYLKGEQIAFARVVTDGCTFAYLCDVVIEEKHRGHGVSKKIMHEIMRHPELSSLRRFTLATQNAHGLYEKFGFKNVDPKIFMEIKRDGI